jgi:hypothetical protein
MSNKGIVYYVLIDKQYQGLHSNYIIDLENTLKLRELRSLEQLMS